MTDVVICGAKEDLKKVEAVGRAISESGIGTWWGDSPDDFWHSDNVVERIGAAKAAVVVWSKNSIRSGLFRAQADAAKRQKKLVQVSADGTKAPAGFPVGAADLTDWKGQPGHGGWKQVMTRIEALTGGAATAASVEAPKQASPPKAAAPKQTAAAKVEEAPRAKAAPTPTPAPAPRAAAKGGPGGRPLRLALLAVPLLVALLVVGTAMGWVPDLRPGGRDKAEAPVSAPVAVRPQPQPRPALQPEPAPAPVELAEAPKVTEREAPKPERAKAAARAKAAKASRPRPAAKKQAPRPKVKYRYSENMRLFCQGAGKATRECRIFRRNAPARRPGPAA